MTDPLARDIAAVQAIDAVRRILDVICQVTGMGFSAVARVTETRWVACQVRDDVGLGLGPGGELQITETMCQQVRDTGQLVVFNSASADPVWSAHPVPAQYGIESYISMPIFTPDGAFFGTLCALDPKPSRIESPEQVEMIRIFAELIGVHLATQERLAVTEDRLAAEQRTAELREQFIAVLGHDLRNPLAAIRAGTRLLARRVPEAGLRDVVGSIEASALRMSRLIDDVTDFARGRLGGGLPVRVRQAVALEAVLRQVAGEVAAGAAGRRIEVEVAPGLSATCDPDRVAQLAGNLLANAVTHGAPRRPDPGGCPAGRRHGRDPGRESGPADSAAGAGAPVQALRARPGRRGGQQGAGARPLHRLRDRRRAWGLAVGRVRPGGDGLRFPVPG